MEIFNLIKDIFLEYESLIYPIFLLIFMLIINYISIKDYDYMIVRKEELKDKMEDDLRELYSDKEMDADYLKRASEEIRIKYKNYILDVQQNYNSLKLTHITTAVVIIATCIVVAFIKFLKSGF